MGAPRWRCRWTVVIEMSDPGGPLALRFIGDRSAGTSPGMIGEIVGDFIAGSLTFAFGGKRAVRRARRKLAAGADAVLPGLLLRPGAHALNGFVRVQPPRVWWRPGETSAFGEKLVCSAPDRVRLRSPHPAERKRGVPMHWTVLVLTVGETRSVLAVPEHFGHLLLEVLRPEPDPVPG